MKIAVVTWIINDVGGINSWTENFLLGLRRLGHNPQLFYGSHQNRLNCNPDKKVMRSRRWHLLPSKHLSYNLTHLKSSINTLNEFDLIVFAHPSPHPTKSNIENVSEPRAWQSFYTETHPLKISIFHDRHWDRSNKWIEEVKNSIDYVYAAQHHFLEAVKKFAGKDVNCGWGMFPLVITEGLSGIKSKHRRFILATQWLALKNHRFLLPHLDKLKIPLHSYGSGQTYHTLLPVMREKYREDHHQDEVLYYNSKSKHVHWGHTEYRKVLRKMRRSWFSLDLSVQGMTNMTHWEPLSVGTISVLENRVVEDSFCEIPKDCCISFDLDNILEELNTIALTPLTKLKKTREKAWKFVQKCECSVVAKSILKSGGVV